MAVVDDCGVETAQRAMRQESGHPAIFTAQEAFSDAAA